MGRLAEEGESWMLIFFIFYFFPLLFLWEAEKEARLVVGRDETELTFCGKLRRKVLEAGGIELLVTAFLVGTFGYNCRNFCALCWVGLMVVNLESLN